LIYIYHRRNKTFLLGQTKIYQNLLFPHLKKNFPILFFHFGFSPVYLALVWLTWPLEYLLHEYDNHELFLFILVELACFHQIPIVSLVKKNWVVPISGLPGILKNARPGGKSCFPPPLFSSGLLVWYLLYLYIIYYKLFYIIQVKYISIITIISTNSVWHLGEI